MNLKLFANNEKKTLYWHSPMIRLDDHASPYKIYKIRVMYERYETPDTVKRGGVVLSEIGSGPNYIDYGVGGMSVLGTVKTTLTFLEISSKNAIRSVGLQIRKLLPR